MAVEIKSSWWSQFYFFMTHRLIKPQQRKCVITVLTVTVHLRQRSAPPGLSPAPTSPTLLLEKWRSLLPYKTAGILLEFIKKGDSKMDDKWQQSVFVCMCVHLTWAGLDDDAHPPPDGVKVQNMEQLKPVESQAGVIKELVPPLAAHFTCVPLSCSQTSGLFTTEGFTSLWKWNLSLQHFYSPVLQSPGCRPAPLQLFCLLKIANHRQATAEMIKTGCLHGHSLCTIIYPQLKKRTLLFLQIRTIGLSVSLNHYLYSNIRNIRELFP